MTDLRWPRAILHVDMDAFYASVEERDNPTLRGKPILVGGDSRRGVVAAASYAARRFGCRSAMPTAKALVLCPHAVLIRPRISHYAQVSRAVFEIFARYTPAIEGLSLDEAFLDVTGSQSLFGTPPEIASAIRAAIQHELQLTASAGVATSKFIAKIASGHNKPNGQTVIVADAQRAFLAALPIENMWGVGAKTLERAHRFGIRTFADLESANRADLTRIFGSSSEQIVALARGEDARAVVVNRAAKSIGAEVTFDQDLRTRESIEASLLAHAQTIAQRLTQSKQRARTVTLKLKLADFTLISRQKTLSESVANTDALFASGRHLLRGLALPGLPTLGVRLTGLSASGLAQESGNLFADVKTQKADRLEYVNETLSRKFGVGLVRASLLRTRDKS